MALAHRARVHRPDEVTVLFSDTKRAWLTDTVTSAITTAGPLLRHPGLSAAHYRNPTHHSAITMAGPLRGMSSYRHDTQYTYLVRVPGTQVPNWYNQIWHPRGSK